jgi:protein N-terminal methyltransferase
MDKIPLESDNAFRPLIGCSLHAEARAVNPGVKLKNRSTATATPDHSMESDTKNSSATDSQISIPSQVSYWQSISPDVTGMLGGFPQVSRIDVQFSRNFIQKLRRLDAKNGVKVHGQPGHQSTDSSTENATKSFAFQHALEPGAGIGRLTLNLLAPLCAKIDIIEPVEKFTAVLTAPEGPLIKDNQLERVWNLPLQEWTPDVKPSFHHHGSNQIQQDNIDKASQPAYDLIFNQWCLNHLSFSSLEAYFKTLIPLLLPGGWIIVKENLSTEAFGADVFDAEDSSVTRSDANWRLAFDQAGLKIVKTELQTGFPKELGLFPVRIYALRPR